MSDHPRSLIDLGSFYARIDPARRQIRLVTLLPGKWTEDPKCKLSVVSLEDKPKYEALSYVWGEVSGTTPICLEDHSVLVTGNLHMALRRLRHADQSRVLWIDALCIQQDNSKSSFSPIFSVHLSSPRTVLEFCVASIPLTGTQMKKSHPRSS